MITFSVCLPTYNGAKYLSSCLESLRAQSYSDFEIIICDDSSTDGTLEILKRFAKTLPNCRLYQNPTRLGLVGNWNRCVELAQGEWIKFLFQDDVLEPECLASFAERLNPSQPLIFCRRRFLFAGKVDNGIRQHYHNLPSIEQLFPDQTFIQPEALLETILTQTQQNFLGEPTACLLHRSVFERFGSFNAELVQFCDFEYWIRIGIHCGIAYIPKTLATFRIHPESTSAGNRRRFRSEYLDRLLILNAWCYHPLYEPLRQRARQLGIPLKQKLAAKFFWLEQYSRQLAKDAPEILEDWDQVVTRHPELDQNPYLLIYRFKAWINRYLLWRLKS
jgi:glycosyltransferase involved in cell wall biosynthesis